MNETSLNAIYILSGAIVIAALIGFYNLCANVAAIKKLLEKKETEITNQKTTNP